jgi:hypothetical protein
MVFHGCFGHPKCVGNGGVLHPFFEQIQNCDLALCQSEPAGVARCDYQTSSDA